MKHNNWTCLKCKHQEYELEEIRVAGSFWTKIFNIQNKIYTSVSCIKCSYTEFYKNQPSSKISNIFDFFTN
jgi:hypothetical protein